MASSISNSLIIGEGLVGSALAAQLPTAAVWARRKGFDLADEATWPDTTGYEVAFFCAAIARMNLCADDPAGTRFINVTQTIKLMQKLVNAGARCIFLSTDKVFNGAQPHIAPDAPTTPETEYGRQKAEVEAWCRTQPLCTILRLTKVIGPDMPLFDQWLSSDPAEAFSDMTLAPVWVGDVVDAMLQIAAERRSGIEQISGAEDISYADLARLLTPQVKEISYRDKNMPDAFAPPYTSYQVTIGPARTPKEVISLWRAAQNSGKNA